MEVLLCIVFRALTRIVFVHPGMVIVLASVRIHGLSSDTQNSCMERYSFISSHSFVQTESLHHDEVLSIQPVTILHLVKTSTRIHSRI
jgi:hypothetical protein